MVLHQLIRAVCYEKGTAENKKLLERKYVTFGLGYPQPGMGWTALEAVS